MTPDQIKDKYEARIMALLNQMREHLIRMGYPCDQPGYSGGDDHGWSLVVGDMTDNKAADIKFTIAEQGEYDGDGDGVTFEIMITEFGGRILGQHCPYNYSNQLWISSDDEDAIEERFQLFENPDLDMFSDRGGLHTRFTNSCVEQVLINGEPPAIFGYDWIHDGCEMHQWCSGAKALSQELLNYISHDIRTWEGHKAKNPGNPQYQIDIDNLTALRDYLSGQLLQLQEA